MKKCPNCNANNDNDAKFCSSCGADLREVQPVPVETRAAQMPVDNAISGMTIAALILGIVSIIIAFIGIFVASFICGLIGLICGIVGVCLAYKGYKNGNRGGLIIASIVCSIVGLVFSAIIFILGIVILAA